MGEDKRYFETEEHVRLYVEARPTVPANLVTAIKQYLQAHLRTRPQLHSGVYKDSYSRLPPVYILEAHLKKKLFLFSYFFAFPLWMQI